jgi:hypothetical protein
MFGLKQFYLLVGTILTIIPIISTMTPNIAWIISSLTGYVYVSMGNNNESDVLSRPFFFHVALTSVPMYIIGPLGILNNDKIQSIILGLFYIIGLHFTYLDNLPAFKHFVLKPSAMVNWGWKQWLIFTCLVIGISFCIIYNAKFIIRDKLVQKYLTGYLTTVLVIVLISMYLSPTYQYHIHHFFVALFFMPLTRFPNRISAAMMGLLLGVYIEGVSAWGLAWIWDKVNKN